MTVNTLGTPHDPLCPCTAHSKCYSTRDDDICFYCKCKEFSVVRADERQRAILAVLDHAAEAHRHVDDGFGSCSLRLGDRCDITTALKVAANRLREMP